MSEIKGIYGASLSILDNNLALNVDKQYNMPKILLIWVVMGWQFLEAQDNLS